jgi:hypothetical protein
MTEKLDDLIFLNRFHGVLDEGLVEKDHIRVDPGYLVILSRKPLNEEIQQSFLLPQKMFV